MLKEWIVQIYIKPVSKSDISGNPFNRICHVQRYSCFQRFWVIMSEIHMNDLQKEDQLWHFMNPKTPNKTAKLSKHFSHLISIVLNNDVLVCVKDMLATITVLIRM